MNELKTLTFNEIGAVLTETQDGVTMPADYSFETVNDYVHSTERHYEELQALCLGMASHIDKQKKIIDEALLRFKQYEMDVGGLPPEHHREFMNELESAQYE